MHNTNVMTAAFLYGEAWKALAACDRWWSTRFAPMKRGCKWCGHPSTSWAGALTIDDKNNGSHGESHWLRVVLSDDLKGSVITSDCENLSPSNCHGSNEYAKWSTSFKWSYAKAIINCMKRQRIRRKRNWSFTVLDMCETFLFCGCQ